MKYEVKAVKYVGSPQSKDATTFIQYVNVTTGIVGNEYVGFDVENTVAVEFPATGMDATQIASKIQQDAITYSKEKYPDTE